MNDRDIRSYTDCPACSGCGINGPYQMECAACDGHDETYVEIKDLYTKADLDAAWQRGFKESLRIESE